MSEVLPRLRGQVRHGRSRRLRRESGAGGVGHVRDRPAPHLQEQGVGVLRRLGAAEFLQHGRALAAAEGQVLQGAQELLVLAGDGSAPDALEEGGPGPGPAGGLAAALSLLRHLQRGPRQDGLRRSREVQAVGHQLPGCPGGGGGGTAEEQVSEGGQVAGILPVKQVAHGLDRLGRLEIGQVGQRTGAGMQQGHVLGAHTAGPALRLDLQAALPGFLDEGRTALVEYEPACGQLTHSRLPSPPCKAAPASPGCPRRPPAAADPEPGVAPDLSLGIDLGTTSVKVLLVDSGGRVVGRASAGYPLHTPRPGWVEQDPDDWWQATCAALREAARQVDPARIRGLSLSGQLNGGLFLDEAPAAVAVGADLARPPGRRALPAHR